LRYSSDEELGKAAFEDFVFRGTRYAHPSEGTVAGLRSVTLDDVRAFYKSRFTAASALLGLGGGYDDATVARFKAAVGTLPAGTRPAAPAIEPEAVAGRSVLLIAKPGADSSISFGFPVDVHRGERDFYALWIANSWLGEHRNQASHLFQVIREHRGLNYGDYSYIEAFPEGGHRTMPPVNVPRREQLFEIWIRTLPNDRAVFALRAALRELQSLVDHGLTEQQFELTRGFLKKYSLHFAETTSARLGYAVDDRFYGIDGEGQSYSAPRSQPLDNPNSLPYPSQELPAFLTACREVAHDDQFGLVCVPAGGMSGLVGLGLAAPPAPRAAPCRRHGPCPAAPQTAYPRRLPGLPSAGDRPCGNGPAVRINDTLARAEKPPGGTQTD